MFENKVLEFLFIAWFPLSFILTIASMGIYGERDDKAQSFLSFYKEGYLELMTYMTWFGCVWATVLFVYLMLFPLTMSAFISFLGYLSFKKNEDDSE